MKVAVVGLGLIGGSMALEFRDTQFASDLCGVESDSENATTAWNLRLVDRVSPLEEALKEARLAVLAVPVDAIQKLLEPALDALDDAGVVTDVGSTKQEIVGSASQHSRRKRFVPSHPMAGTENSGPTAAIFGLFKNKTAVICDADQCDADAVDVVEKMYESLKMRVVHMSSKEHDMHAAYVSHLSHISSFVLANTVLDIERDVSSIFDLAGGGFESTVRLAKSSPDMWLPIFEQNHQHVAASLAAYIRHLQEFEEALRNKKWEKVRALLEKANGIRRILRIMTNRKAAK